MTCPGFEPKQKQKSEILSAPDRDGSNIGAAARVSALSSNIKTSWKSFEKQNKN